MAVSIEAIKENYNANLKAKDYNKKFNRILHLIRGNFEFILQFLHEIVHSGRFKGSKVLEVGSGATVHNIASASACYDHIVQSDYVVDNCEELKRWHEGTSSLDWSQFLDIIIHIEDNENDLMTARKELESRIRKSVKCVVRSDLLSDTVLPLEPLIATETEPPFDLVISVLCIETAAPDYEGYIDILKRINSLLKVGGGLIICGYENGSMWQVGDKTFHHIKLTTKQLLEALGTAGFGKCDLRTCPKRESEYSYDYETLFCVAAEKL